MAAAQDALPIHRLMPRRLPWKQRSNKLQVLYGTIYAYLQMSYLHFFRGE